MNSKLLGQVSLGSFPSRPLISYLLDLTQRKFCSVAFLSHRASSLLRHVAYIVEASAKPEMVRSNARRIVAVMKNPKSFGNGSKVKNPTGNMCFDSRITTPSVNPSIGKRRLFVPTRSCPNPAPFTFLYVGPKASLESWGKALRGKIFSGNLDHSSVLPRIGYWPTEALSL